LLLITVFIILFWVLIWFNSELLLAEYLKKSNHFAILLLLQLELCIITDVGPIKFTFYFIN